MAAAFFLRFSFLNASLQVIKAQIRERERARSRRDPVKKHNICISPSLQEPYLLPPSQQSLCLQLQAHVCFSQAADSLSYPPFRNKFSCKCVKSP